MNSIELYGEVKSWLEAEEVAFATNEEDRTFGFRMTLEAGFTQVRIVCEESPASVQVICTLPIKVPKDKMGATSLLLHSANLRLRIGAFQFLADDRVITLRLPMPIHQEIDLQQQLRAAFGTALGTLDEHLAPFSLFLCSTPEAKQALAKLAPKRAATKRKAGQSRNRLELN
jgi:hypothetical protein